MPNPTQPQRPVDGTPSSSEEDGRGNSGEGKDPKEGLYPPADESPVSPPGTDSKTGAGPGSRQFTAR